MASRLLLKLADNVEQHDSPFSLHKILCVSTGLPEGYAPETAPWDDRWHGQSALLLAGMHLAWQAMLSMLCSLDTLSTAAQLMTASCKSSVGHAWGCLPGSSNGTCTINTSQQYCC